MIMFITDGERVSRDERAEQLILAMADGSTAALGELYELVGGFVYSYALSRTSDKTVAEDLTHDTFLRIYQNARQYTPMGKPMAWIVSVELNIIRRYYNKNSRVIYTDDLESETDSVDVVEGLIEDELVGRLLASLRDDEREIVLLHAVGGLKHREIARLLGMPLATVLSKYSRAIKKMQKLANTEEG